MKNMKVSMKLIAGFACVIVLAVAIGVAGIVGLRSMSDAAENMYTNMAIPLSELGNATEYFQRVRVQMRNAAIYSGNTEQLVTVEEDINNRMSMFETTMEAYGPTIVTVDGQQLHAKMMEEYNNVMKPGVITLMSNAKLGVPIDELIVTMEIMSITADNIAAQLRQLNQLRLNVMSNANDGTTVLYQTLFWVILAIIVFAVGFSMFLALYISGLISKPLGTLSAFMRKSGETGDITLSEHDRRDIDSFGKRKDEIGQTISACAMFLARITEISSGLETVSNGDLRIDIVPLTDRDTLGVSLQKMTDSLNRMFGEVNSSTTQVTTGATQVADGAQALAAGATEQAASVQELSSSIAEIAERTRTNATKAGDAARLAESIKLNAEKGSHQMDDMMAAVKDINNSSRDISKVIKVIDDIAFQTNILALNAAVEAARAGAHGKGFAVVAEEVRNLAAKSADAAKNTESLIAGSMKKAEDGVRIAGETSDSLTEIVYGINESNAIVSEIAASSEEQSIAITQINIGIDQVAQVVQQNSATAQESAAASEEMSSQATLLQHLVSQFKTKDIIGVADYKRIPDFNN